MISRILRPPSRRAGPNTAMYYYPIIQSSKKQEKTQEAGVDIDPFIIQTPPCGFPCFLDCG